MLNQYIPGLKTIMLGKSTVGKTTVVCRMETGKFALDSQATVGASFSTIYHRGIKYNVWDTGGQERFRSLMPAYIRGSRIVIFIFDMENLSTFDVLGDHALELSSLEQYYIIVVGNKSDLLNDEQLSLSMKIIQIKIDNSELKKNIWGYAVVSAKTGENFEHFLTILNECAIEISNSIASAKTSDNSAIQITAETDTGCSC